MAANTVEFSFDYKLAGIEETRSIKASIPIPYKGDVKELAVLLMDSNRCPCYVEKDLLQSLIVFVNEEMRKRSDTIGDEILLKAFQQEVRERTIQ